LTIVDRRGDLSPLFLCPLLTGLDWRPAARGTGDITHNIEGIDEEFREFCPAGCVPGKLNHIKADSIGLGVVGSLAH